MNWGVLAGAGGFGDRLSINQQVVSNWFVSQHMSLTDLFFFQFSTLSAEEGQGVSKWLCGT